MNIEERVAKLAERKIEEGYTTDEVQMLFKYIRILEDSHTSLRDDLEWATTHWHRYEAECGRLTARNAALKARLVG